MPAHVTPDFSRPGPPTDNGFIEAVTGNLRMARLNAHWFLSPAGAREDPEDYRRHKTEDRQRDQVQGPDRHASSGWRRRPALGRQTEHSGDRRSSTRAPHTIPQTMAMIPPREAAHPASREKVRYREKLAPVKGRPVRTRGAISGANGDRQARARPNRPSGRRRPSRRHALRRPSGPRPPRRSRHGSCRHPPDCGSAETAARHPAPWRKARRACPRPIRTRSGLSRIPDRSTSSLRSQPAPRLGRKPERILSSIQPSSPAPPPDQRFSPRRR
ncbi:transposase [Rhodovulum sulfidophilum]|nr:transposase [Rhodovulum sulfidophilum]